MRFLASLASLSTVTLVLASGGCSLDAGPGEVDEEGNVAEAVDAVSVPAAAGPLEFRDGCRDGTHVTVAAVGDVLLHGPLQVQAYAAPNGHESLWSDVKDVLASADVTYANLEGPCADGLTTTGPARDPGRRFDEKVYTSYPQFNYHPSLVPALKESGFDVVSTANNHALDRRAAGADRTIAHLRESGLAFSGSRLSSGADRGPWHVVTDVKGIRIAWIACTFSTNGIPDASAQVLHCYDRDGGGRPNPELLDAIHGLAAAKEAVDAVLVTPHWGIEYKHAPEAQERALAKAMLEAGALAVIGGHPHVVQPWEKVQTTDGREGFVLYSLGNFVSGQVGVARRSSLALFLGLTKGADGKVTIDGVRHLPLAMLSGPYRVVPAEASPATAENLALTTRLLGTWNKLAPGEPVVTNPRCGAR